MHEIVPRFAIDVPAYVLVLSLLAFIVTIVLVLRKIDGAEPATPFARPNNFYPGEARSTGTIAERVAASSYSVSSVETITARHARTDRQAPG